MSEKNSFFSKEKIIDEISKKILNYDWDNSIIWEIIEKRHIPAIREYRIVSIKVDPKLFLKSGT